MSVCGCGMITCPYCNPNPANRLPPMWPNVQPSLQQGWLCPVCKAVYAPSMLFCLNCNGKTKPTAKNGESE